MSETNTKVNDDGQCLITNTTSNINNNFSFSKQQQNSKELIMPNMKLHHRQNSNVITSKSLIPPLIENHQNDMQRDNNREKSLKLSDSIQSRNDPSPKYQTLSPILEPSINYTQLATSNNQNSNEINFKDRRLIRIATKRFTLSNHDKDDIESFNQITQFKTNDINTLNTFSNNEVYPPSLSRNHMPFTEQNVLSTDRTFRTIYNSKDLKKLMKTNPFHSLKNNFKYTFNQNQLSYIKETQKAHRLINYTKTKDKNALYKVNRCSTIFVKQQKVKGNLIKRLISRKNVLPGELKAVIFWEGIKWVWMNYSVQIKKLLFSFMNFKWYLDKEILLTQNAINELFSLILIDKGNDFTEALFLVFHEHNNPYINMKIVINVFIVTNKASTVAKIKETMNIWATGAEEGVKLTDIVTLAQLIFSHKSDVRKVIELGKKYLNITDLSDVIVSKHTLIKMCLQEEGIKYLIKRNKIDLNKYAQIFENEIMNMYNINLRNSKGLIDLNEAQRQCESEVMKYEKILSVITECENNRKKLEERILADEKDSD